MVQETPQEARSVVHCSGPGASLLTTQTAPALLDAKRRASPQLGDAEGAPKPGEASQDQTTSTDTTAEVRENEISSPIPTETEERSSRNASAPEVDALETSITPLERPTIHPRAASFAQTVSREDFPTPRSRITFDPAADRHPNNDATLSIPGPRERDRGAPIVELSDTRSLKTEGELANTMHGHDSS